MAIQDIGYARFGSNMASFDGKKWTCADSYYNSVLNGKYSLDDYKALNSFDYIPDVISTIIEWAVKELKGEIVSIPEQEKDIPGAIY